MYADIHVYTFPPSFLNQALPPSKPARDIDDPSHYRLVLLIVLYMCSSVDDTMLLLCVCVCMSCVQY